MFDMILRCIAMLFVSMAITACSSDSFKMEGNISDAGNSPLRIVYVNESGVQSVKIPVEAGRFSVEGVSGDYTVVSLYSERNKLLTNAVMRNGDKLKLRGTIKHNTLIEMKGSDVNEEWNNFRRDNHTLYEEGKEALLNTKIEEYVAANTDKMSSLLLLLYDYSALDSTARVHDMLNKIDEKVRSTSIMKAYADMNAMLTAQNEPKKKIPTLSFYNEKDSMVSFSPLRSKMSVLYFYVLSDSDRKDILFELDSLMTDFGSKKRLQVGDVLMDGDADRWKKSLEKDKSKRMHYFVVGGMMNKSIIDMQIHDTPFYIVFDSIGQIVYRGDSISEVSRLVHARFGK